MALIALAGCAQIPRKSVVDGPTTVEPPPRPEADNAEIDGSIYRSGYTNSFFEDRRPVHIGDLLTVIIDEDVSATKSSESKANRKGSSSLEINSLPKVLSDAIKDLEAQGYDISGLSDFSGSGGASASNSFTGVLTVTVIDRLANGNLRVAGEKRIGINKGVEYIVFSGVVNPSMIRDDETISSSEIADVRLEYYGDGYISEAQEMGWLQRLFINISPF